MHLLRCQISSVAVAFGISPMNQQIELSIVVPMRNEQDSLNLFFDTTIPVLVRMGIPWEILCVNDGSSDNTLSMLLDRRRQDRRIKIVDLSRNFGKEAAMTAGLELCTGSAVVPMDADLQDPPELIPKMLEKWQTGAEVVYARRATRESDTLLKRFTALKFYGLLNALSEIPIPHNTGDFRLMDRKVVEALKRLPERTRFMKGLFAWLGFRQECVYYHRAKRVGGITKWSYWRLWNFAIEGIVSFSSLPLRIWSYLGLATALIGFCYMIYLILRTLVLGIDVPGYASLMVVLLFIGGLQLISLGILGEYLSRVFSEVKHRPLYVVRQVYGLENFTA